MVTLIKDLSFGNFYPISGKMSFNCNRVLSLNLHAVDNKAWKCYTEFCPRFGYGYREYVLDKSNQTEELTGAVGHLQRGALINKTAVNIREKLWCILLMLTLSSLFVLKLVMNCLMCWKIYFTYTYTCICFKYPNLSWLVVVLVQKDLCL